MSPTPETAQAEPAARHAVTHATRAKDGLLIGALLAGRTFEEAAQAAGVCRRTAYRMRQSAEFQQAYQSAKDELISAAVSALHSNALLFVTTLAAICQDPKARGSEKAVAADRGLSQLFKAHELWDLEQRIAKLEQTAGEGRK
jgi:hypothetical protein